MFELVLCVVLIGILISLIVISHKHRSFRKQIENKTNGLNQLETKVNTLLNSRSSKQSQPIESTPDSIKELLSDLKDLFEVLTNQNENIQQSIKRIAIIFENISQSQDKNSIDQSVENTKTSTDSQEITAPFQDGQREQDEHLSQELQTFCNIYNNRQVDQLQMNYHPSFRVQVSNALERRKNPDITPIFETNDRGKFWVFYIEDESHYSVVPFHDLTLEHSTYQFGGFDFVFECPDFDPGSQYKNLRVIKPGIFKPDSQNHQWNLIEQGKLDLGPSR